MVKRPSEISHGPGQKHRKCNVSGCICPHSTQRCNSLDHGCICVYIGPEYCHSTLHFCTCPYDYFGDFNCRASVHFIRQKRKISEVDMTEDAGDVEDVGGSKEVDYIPVIAGAYNAAMYSLFGYSLFWAPHKML